MFSPIVNGQAIVITMMVMEIKTKLKTSFSSPFIVRFVKLETEKFAMLRN